LSEAIGLATLPFWRDSLTNFAALNPGREVAVGG
jgi:hypothetical protein